MAHALEIAAPALERLRQIEQRFSRAWRQLIRFDDLARGLIERNDAGAGQLVDALDRRVAEAALRHVDDALEFQIVGGVGDDVEIGDRVLDFLALVKARTADDAIGKPERDEAIFDGAHLGRSAHQNGHVVQRSPCRAADSRSARR